MSTWPQININFDPLVKTTCSGMEKLAGLLFGPFIRAEERRNLLAQAQNKQDVQRIENGEIVLVDGELRPALTAVSPLLAIGQQHDMVNLAGNLKNAMDILADTPDENISNKDVDPDWFSRWRQGATVIGNKEMQSLWGRILAEEIKEPASFSYRTLDTLKNITNHSACIFIKAISMQLGPIIPCSTEQIFHGLRYVDTTELINAGLLLPKESIYYGAYSAENNEYHFVGNKVIFCAKTKEKIEGSGISGLTLSTAGLEISKISDSDTPSEEQILYIMNLFKENDKNKKSFTSISVHPMITYNKFSPGVVIGKTDM